jgi:hypothetical protein
LIDAELSVIISSVRLEMDEIKKANEVWREAEIVTHVPLMVTVEKIILGNKRSRKSPREGDGGYSNTLAH